MVKYIAKSAAKNISSEDNQTIVPTLTMFGRLTAPCGPEVSSAVAVATRAIMSLTGPGHTPGPPRGASRVRTYPRVVGGTVILPHATPGDVPPALTVPGLFTSWEFDPWESVPPAVQRPLTRMA